MLACAAAAEDARTFPDAECSYTLPSSDWKWLNPEQIPTAGRTIAFAKSPKGLAIVIGVAQLKPDEKPTARFYEAFEGGMLESGHLKKIGSENITFKSIPSFQIEASLPTGQGTVTRVLCANERLYCLQVINGLGPLNANVDTDAVFQGFNFIGTPRPVSTSADVDRAFELGRQAGPGLALVVGIVALCIYLLKRNRTSRTA